jgi:hypothetical protein
MFTTYQKVFTVAFAGLLATSVDASQLDYADPRIAELCGPDHQNELASPDDVVSNFTGFFVRNTDEQVYDGDPRVILTNQDAPYLCTSPTIGETMPNAGASSTSEARTVRFLFVPDSKLYPETSDY